MRVLHTALLSNFKSGIGIINQMYDELESAKNTNIDFDVKIFSPFQEVPSKYVELFEFCNLNMLGNKILFWVNYRKAYYNWLKSKDVDCYILRYSTYDPFQYFFIRDIQKPVYLVHHTKELDELGLLGIKGKIMSFVDRFIGNQSIKLSKGIIGVTNEIIEYEKTRIKDLSKNSILYSNGIKIRDRELLDKRSNDTPEILFVASYFHNWHGLDLLISEVKNSKRNFLIHIVGNISLADSEYLKKDKRFIFHSNLTSDEIFEISEKCWIALGSFALYRKNVKEGSTLKVREYLNNGLPVYSGHIDSFPKDFIFYKYSVLNMDEILDFAYNMRGYSKNDIKKTSERYISKEILLKELYNEVTEKLKVKS